MSAVKEEGGMPSASTDQKIVTSALASQSYVARLSFRLPLVPLNESALVTIHSHGPDALAPMLARALAWSFALGDFPEYQGAEVERLFTREELVGHVAGGARLTASRYLQLYNGVRGIELALPAATGALEDVIREG